MDTLARAAGALSTRAVPSFWGTIRHKDIGPRAEHLK
jgi:hypothetical protein